MLQIPDLKISFLDGPKVADDVSLSLVQRNSLVIIGETGSGKSVLLLAALGLLPQSARVTGEILFNGKNLLGCSKAVLNQLRGAQTSYIPQGSGNGLNPLYTVGHQMREMLAQRQKEPKPVLTAKAVDLLRNYRLDEPHKLFHGNGLSFSVYGRARSFCAPFLLA